ncbi:MAG: hypothetical protein AB7Y46_01650 [Armatimonadota bacterium]
MIAKLLEVVTADDLLGAMQVLALACGVLALISILTDRTEAH